MKNRNKIYAIMLTLILSVASCDKGFDELNVDPNQPTSVPAHNLLTQGQFATSNLFWGRAINFDFGMLMVQHFSNNEYAERSRYNLFPANFNAVWVGYYAGGMSNINEAINLVTLDETLTENQRANRLAVLTILRVWTLHMITDIWGDVPYTEAFQPEEFPNPKYDRQSDIYPGLIAELDGAINSINQGTPGFTAGDLMFGGDMTRWYRFANSLKLKIGMRMADVNSALASTVVSQAAPNVFQSAAEEALFLFNSDQRLANPFFVDESVNNRDDFAISLPLVQHMENTNDPRLEMYANPNPSDEIVGMPPGLTDPEAFALKSITSRPHSNVRTATAPAKILTYAEVKFFLAEAIQRGFIGGDAATEYAEAITASMAEWGITDATVVNDYIANNPYNAANFRQSLGMAKWVALYTQGIEAWCEWRRLDYPQLAIPAAAVHPATPVRAFYPAIEEGVNGSSLSAVPYDNQMSVKVWWDVN